MHSRRLSHNQTCLDMILLSPAADPQGGGGVFYFNSRVAHCAVTRRCR